MLCMRKILFISLVLAALLFSVGGASANESPAGSLTLDQALSLALERNPQLSASLSEIQARDARIIQARVFQNPEIELEIENALLESIGDKKKEAERVATEKAERLRAREAMAARLAKEHEEREAQLCVSLGISMERLKFLQGAK